MAAAVVQAAGPAVVGRVEALVGVSGAAVMVATMVVTMVVAMVVAMGKVVMEAEEELEGGRAAKATVAAARVVAAKEAEVRVGVGRVGVALAADLAVQVERVAVGAAPHSRADLVVVKVKVLEALGVE